MSPQRPADGTRHNRAAVGLDFYPTPPWATLAICEAESWGNPPPTVWEPAAGAGDLADALRASGKFGEVAESDIRDHANRGIEIADFLRSPNRTPAPDWIITNPPFQLFAEFARQAIAQARVGVAMFGRLAAIESAVRYRTLWQPLPPDSVWAFAERVALAPGRLATRTDSAAIAFGWFVWRRNPADATRLRWIGAGARDHFGQRARDLGLSA